jgi:methylthioribulose-1-phosphate dehydratase
MATSFDDLDPQLGLVEVGKQFHQRGWMSGTAGNLSVRTDDKFWITASGKPKGQLDGNDFVQVRISDGEMCRQDTDGNRPSAETCIHQAIYSLFDDAQACLHVHSIDAIIATQRFATERSLRLPPLEMVKGFDIWQQNPEIDLPVFDNILDVAHIATAIRDHYQQHSPQLSALMIRDHGITVWGNSLQQAYNRVEITEFLMSYLARKP